MTTVLGTRLLSDDVDNAENIAAQENTRHKFPFATFQLASTVTDS